MAKVKAVSWTAYTNQKFRHFCLGQVKKSFFQNSIFFDPTFFNLTDLGDLVSERLCLISTSIFLDMSKNKFRCLFLSALKIKVLKRDGQILGFFSN